VSKLLKFFCSRNRSSLNKAAQDLEQHVTDTTHCLSELQTTLKTLSQTNTQLMQKQQQIEENVKVNKLALQDNKQALKTLKEARKQLHQDVTTVNQLQTEHLDTMKLYPDLTQLQEPTNPTLYQDPIPTLPTPSTKPLPTNPFIPELKHHNPFQMEPTTLIKNHLLNQLINCHLLMPSLQPLPFLLMS